MIFDLFEIDERNYTIKIKKEVYKLPFFKELFTLKYNKQEGDNDGRKRYRGELECLFIYYMYHPASTYYWNYAEKERRIEVLTKVCSVKSNYKISSELNAVIKYYKDEMDKYIVVKSLNASLSSLHTVITVLDGISTKLSDAMDNDELSAEELDTMIDSMNKVLKLNQLIPKSISTIEELKKEVKKNLENAKYARGNKKIGNRENPR